MDEHRAQRTVDDASTAAILAYLALRRPRDVLLVQDDGPAPVPSVTGDMRRVASEVEMRDALTRLPPPDLVWIGGNPGWHSVRRLLGAVVETLASASRLPLVVVEGGAPDPIPPWVGATLETALRRRTLSLTEGLRLATANAMSARESSWASLWSPSRGGLALLVPDADATPEVRSLLQAMRAVSDATGAWLAQILDDSLRDGAEVDDFLAEIAALLAGLRDTNAMILRSRRFRVGDGLVHLARRATRRRDDFVLRARSAQLDDAVTRTIAAIAQRSDRAIDARPNDGERAIARSPDALRVTYLLPNLRIAGGVLGVVQLASELMLLGADARVVALSGKVEVTRWRFLVQPQIFDTRDALLERMDAADIVVATHYSTAELAAELVHRGRARTSAYFLQDYEPWFFSEDDDAGRQGVRDTFDLIPHKIVKSDWLANLMRGDGHATTKIPLGLDLRFFYPRPVKRPPQPVIIAMARPRTPRRGFESVVAALERVKRAVPSAEVILFGQDLSGTHVPFEYRGEGVVDDQERLARLFSRADVHLDGSDFQAFGRPALEAMACGTASVLTNVGGVSEYARHEENCLLVPPRAPELFADAILRLLDDDGLRNRVLAGGFETVFRYSMKREARDTLAYFRQVAASAAPLERGGPRP